MNGAPTGNPGDKPRDDALGIGERIAVVLVRYPVRTLCASFSIVAVFAIALAVALATSPHIFELDATEEGFKVADAPESLTWDFLDAIWTGDYSDDLPEPSLSEIPQTQMRGRRLQKGGGGGGGGGGRGGGRGGAMAAILSEAQQKDMMACRNAASTRQEKQACRRKMMNSLTDEQREKIRGTFGGGKGTGRQKGARAQATKGAAGGAMDQKYTSTSVKRPENFNKMTTAQQQDFFTLFLFRPYFVDVYATKKLDDDPTYWGENTVGYGCCGVFAKEQRTWPDTINLLTKDKLERLRNFENAIASEEQYKQFCFQDRAPGANGAVPARVDFRLNPSGVNCARPFSITNFFWATEAEVPADDVDCKELYDAGLFCQYLDGEENVMELGTDGLLHAIGKTKSTSRNESFARFYTPDGRGDTMRPLEQVKTYLADLWDKNLMDPNYRLLLDHKFSGTRQISRGLVSKMVFEKPAPVRPWMEDQTKGMNIPSEEEWQKQFDKWLNEKYLPLLKKYTEDDVDYLAYAASFLDTWRREGIDQAILWSAGAICLVYILLWARLIRIFKTKGTAGRGLKCRLSYIAMSFVLPCGALFHVLVSFPVSWAIYRFLYQQKYVGYMQFISIFIILGIGVDDVFIMFDAWLQSTEEGFDETDLESRMRFAWVRASKAMLITSVTDSLAFLANAFSVIAAVRLFGYMIATMVVVNYILDVTLFPALLVVVTRWVQRRSSPSGVADGQPAGDTVSANVIGVPEPKAEDEAPVAKLRPRKSHVESFFQERLSPRLDRGRIFILLITGLVLAGFGVGLSQLKKSDRAFRFETFPDWFPMNRVFNMGNWMEAGDIFGEPTPVQPVFIVWGAKGHGIDLSKMDTNNPLDKGQPWLDPNFALTDPSVQDSILSTCEELQKLPRTRSQQVLCPLRHFKQWFSHPETKGGGFWPITDGKKFMEYLKFFTNMPFDQKRCNVNRRGLGGYQLNGDKGAACNVFFNKTGHLDRPGLAYLSVKQEYAKYFGYDGTGDRVSWVLAAVNSTLSSQSAASDGRVVYDAIQKVLDSGGVSAVQAAKLWPQMVTEEAMVKAAWIGAIISLVVAFFTLLFFTQNLVLAFLCLFSIAGVVVITLGIMPILGWRFGFLEAMCMVFVVGFSVDFIAHVGIAYHESCLENRSLKATQALAEMGVSLFWGMATTVAAGFFLIFCVMVPFSKMGIFLMWNQLVSFVFAVLPFSASLMLFGPVAGQGQLPCPKRCRRSEQSQGEDAVTSTQGAPTDPPAANIEWLDPETKKDDQGEDRGRFDL